MPFKSERQRRYLYAKRPDIARRWAHEERVHKQAANPLAGPEMIIVNKGENMSISAWGIDHGEEIEKAAWSGVAARAGRTARTVPGRARRVQNQVYYRGQDIGGRISGSRAAQIARSTPGSGAARGFASGAATRVAGAGRRAGARASYAGQVGRVRVADFGSAAGRRARSLPGVGAVSGYASGAGTRVSGAARRTGARADYAIRQGAVGVQNTSGRIARSQGARYGAVGVGGAGLGGGGTYAYNRRRRG